MTPTRQDLFLVRMYALQGWNTLLWCFEDRVSEPDGSITLIRISHHEVELRNEKTGSWLKLKFADDVVRFESRGTKLHIHDYLRFVSERNRVVLVHSGLRPQIFPNAGPMFAHEAAADLLRLITTPPSGPFRYGENMTK